ncbi:MAG: phage protein, partial [Burkholderiaceae bacterium]|nr:phage protein [Burkholderiaceae bacterium]
ESGIHLSAVERISAVTNKTEHIHRIKYDDRVRNPAKARQTRMEQGLRLKIMLADLGLTPESAGKILHVAPRTVRYWISGKTQAPYAAYRLLRIMTGAELPCPGWDGWHMHSGKLWSPEGYGFTPGDSSWWGLLVRKARLFHQLYDRETQLNALLARAGRAPAAGAEGALGQPRPVAETVPTGNAGRAAQPPGLNLSLGHFKTQSLKTEDSCGFQPGAPDPSKPPSTLAETNKGGKGVVSWAD